ncbi:hypothetical protein KBX06_24230 [Micromonospora sp. C31]|uniref:hypothetical protein n=1 Tax=Micromonospora sp. C31 TaxID=2824876 RepID=UPI001B39492F|nr:hypothetical protein [Micromonospora sp. C31]MBQ1076240.1 hypothetical protein [Micromonospora sp. C31]
MTALALLVCLAAWLALIYALMSKGGFASGVRQTGRYLLVGVLVIALGALSVLGIWQSFGELRPSWQAATGHGTEGTFMPERMHVIGRGGDRQWRGTFVSTDQTIIRPDVALDSPPDRIQIGLAVPARDTGAQRAVYGEGIPLAAVRNLATLALITLGWGLTGWLLVARLRRQPRSPSAPGD